MENYPGSKNQKLNRGGGLPYNSPKILPGYLSVFNWREYGYIMLVFILLVLSCAWGIDLYEQR